MVVVAMPRDLRQRIHETLTSKRGDSVPGVKFGKSLARFANDLLGKPRASPQPEAPPVVLAPAAAPRKREPAPVSMYVEWDSPGRDAVEQILKANGIAYKVLAVDHDEPTKTFVRQFAKRDPPALFIAADAVGWLDELKALDASGEIKKRVFGS